MPPRMLTLAPPRTLDLQRWTPSQVGAGHPGPREVKGPPTLVNAYPLEHAPVLSPGHQVAGSNSHVIQPGTCGA